MVNLTNKLNRKPNILIIGHGRHGKDTAAEYMEITMDLKFASSSMFVGERCIWPNWGKNHYSCFSDMFEDRVNHRDKWGELIADYNNPDLSRTGREMIEAGNNMYVGMRRIKELEACVSKNIFDHIIWIDACDRLPKEPLSSNELTAEHADIFIDNNGPVETMLSELDVLQDRFHEKGFIVGV